jgi:DNA-binding MurR/RpiR family transcriptional regulator
MTGVKAKIRSLLPNLPNAEKRIAGYILENAREIPFLSVYELAERVTISVASVSRFVKEIGHKSFRDFKVDLAQDNTSAAPEILDAITPDDNGLEIVRKVFKSNIQSLDDTLKLLNIEELVELGRKLSETKRLLFFGIGGSGNVAKDAALRFSHLDIQSEAYTDPVYMIVSAKRLKKSEAAVGISHSGRSTVTIEALRIAQENGALTVGISNYMKSPLSRHADCSFCTSFHESRVKVAALSSRLAQLCLIDALYLLVARHMKKVWDIESLNRLTEKILRTHGSHDHSVIINGR